MYFGKRLFLLVLATFAAGWSPAPAHGRGDQIPISSTVLSSTTSVHRVVALTFDDGPSPYSWQVLDLLKRNGAVATFFLVGAHVPAMRDELRAAVRAGNLLGNHTYTHADLQWLSSAEVVRQLQATQDEAQAAAGVRPHWFRPPYGAVDARVAELAASQGLDTILWSVDPRDWSLPGASVIVDRILSSVRPGSVVLMHDGGGNRSETIAALSAILPALRGQGYRFVTLDDLFFPRLAHPRAQGRGSRLGIRPRRNGAVRHQPTVQRSPTPTPTPTPDDAWACALHDRAPWLSSSAGIVCKRP